MGFDRELVKGTTATVVLRLLREREMYGYEMVKEVNARTGGLFKWKEGTLYPCLHRLEVDGLLRSHWREAPNGKKRKYYRITAKGLAELARRTEEWKQFAGGVNVLLLGKTG
ncbi:MAG: DNA-binding protein [Planctomycetes bacterium SM23_32]|nr:MAG: DNA-binding protein [Planctomycetes bacterium SM23_32]